MSGSGSGSGGYTPMPSSEFNCIYGVIDTNLVSVDFELLKKIYYWRYFKCGYVR